MSETASDTRRLLLITFAALILFTYGLGVGTLWDEDETRYTQVAREILAGGDLLTLRLNSEPWFDKPPLFMWLQALTARVFGFSEFTARLWSAIAGAVTVAATFLLARLFYGSRTAALASAILATTFQFFVQSRIAVLDAMLVAFMLLALYMLVVAYTTGSRRAHLWAWVWTGWATATKGPMGLLLPAMVVCALWVVRRERARWRDVPLWGPVLFALIGLTWYLIETLQYGAPFLRAVVGLHMVTRFFGVVENQAGPWWYYLPVLLVGAFPWTAFLPSAAVYHLRRRPELASQVILLWVGVTLAFFSVAGTKLPSYILPAYPLLAIGIARLCVDAMEGASVDAPRLLRWAFGLVVVGTVIFAAGVAALASVRFPTQLAALRTEMVIIAAAYAAGPLVAVCAFLLRRPAIALGAMVLTIVVALPVLVHRTLPAVERHRPLPRIARLLRDELRAGDGLALVRMSKNLSLLYYTGGPVIWVEDDRSLGRALCVHDRLFLVVPEHDYAAWLSALLPPGTQEHRRDGGYRVLFKDGPTPCVGTRPVQ